VADLVRRAGVAAALALAVACGGGRPLLLDSYLRIQTALAADRADTVKTDAGAMAQAADALGGDGAPLAAAARRLQAAGDLKSARLAFIDVSNALIQYGDAHPGAVPDDLRVAYCDRELWWVQTDGEIANPYYGSASPTCGVFRKQKQGP
jgi:hypothetical protein